MPNGIFQTKFFSFLVKRRQGFVVYVVNRIYKTADRANNGKVIIKDDDTSSQSKDIYAPSRHLMYFFNSIPTHSNFCYFIAFERRFFFDFSSSISFSCSICFSSSICFCIFTLSRHFASNCTFTTSIKSDIRPSATACRMALKNSMYWCVLCLQVMGKLLSEFVNYHATKIVHHQQDRRKKFLCVDQMMNVSSGMLLTSQTLASLKYGIKVLFVTETWKTVIAMLMQQKIKFSKSCTSGHSNPYQILDSRFPYQCQSQKSVRIYA